MPTLLVPAQFATIQSALLVAQSGDIVDASSTSVSQTASIGLRSVTVRFGTGAADIFNIDWSTTTFGLIGSALHFGPKSGYFNNGGFHVEFYDLEKINIKTGSGVDSITTGDFDDTVSLGAGDDQVDTRTGRASVDGGPGVDGWTADLSASSVGITLNLATAVLTQDIGGGNFVAGVERLHLTTGSGNDSIVTLSQALPDWISTGAGDDTVTVAGGSDTIDMGAGSNDFLIVDWSASTFSVGGSATHYGPNSGYFNNGAQNVEFSGVERVHLATGSFDDTVTLSPGADIGIGNGGADTLNGGGGDDTLYGGDGGDTLYGGDGNDTLFGELGADTIYAGPGDDVIDGGAGASSILGGEAGNDTIYGGAGNDYMIGGDGNDTLVGFGGQDSLYGGAGNDYLVAGDGPGAVVDGGAGANTLWGASGADYMVGGEGNDLIVGGGGSDYQFGNAGDDTHYGGRGADYIYTNAGNDFVWTDDVGAPKSTDYVYAGGGTGTDTIADFTPGSVANHDVLVVSLGSGVTTFAQAQAHMVQVGVYTVLTLGADQVYIYNVQPFQLTADNFLFL